MAIGFGWLPPEINSGRMYAGAGAGPMLAAASAWDELAAELHSAAAGYNSVINGLTSEGWMGPASKSMAAAAAPYAFWMSATAAQTEMAAAQARAAAGAYEAAYAATVPPLLVAANRAELAVLVATNILGQNTPAIATNWAHYYEMWAQDATAMDGYAGASKTAAQMTAFTAPPHTTNPAGMSGELASAVQATGNSAGTHTQTLASAMQPMSMAPQAPGSETPSLGMSGLPTAKDAVGWATFVPQNGSYLFSLANAMASLARMMTGGAGAAAATSGADMLAPALSGAMAPALSGLGSGSLGLGGLGGAVTAGLGHSGTIGALSVPQAWAAATPVTGNLGSALGATTVGATQGIGAHPGGLLNGMPMLANAAARSAEGSQMGAMPRFDLRPSVIPISPAAG